MNKILDTVDAIRNWWHDLHFSSHHKRALALIATLVLLSSTFFIINGRSQEVVAMTPPEVLGRDPVALEIVVDVAGGVNRPGVYTLAANARVVDAIKAAGGIKKGADASEVNQARALKDGEQIYIYPAQSSAPTSARGATTRRAQPSVRAPLSINRASASEFEALPGIGPVLAARIISYRKSHGSFTAIEDLLNVPGIGEPTFSKFKNQIRV